MKRPSRPHVTGYAALSTDGRLLPPNPAETARQTAALREFDAVALDGCDLDPAGVTAVWLAIPPREIPRAFAHAGSGILFAAQLPSVPSPSTLQIVREKPDLVRRLDRLRRDFDVRRLFCPLGSTVLPALLALDLVDELHLNLHPVICGGQSAATLSSSPGPLLPSATSWRRTRLIREDDSCALVYRRR